MPVLATLQIRGTSKVGCRYVAKAAAQLATWQTASLKGLGLVGLLIDRVDKDQVTLQRKFSEKYGPRLLPTVKHFVVLGVSWKGAFPTNTQRESSGVCLYARDGTCRAPCHLPERC